MLNLSKNVSIFDLLQSLSNTSILFLNYLQILMALKNITFIYYLSTVHLFLNKLTLLELLINYF